MTVETSTTLKTNANVTPLPSPTSNGTTTTTTTSNENQSKKTNSAIDTIMSSLALKRRTSGVFGSKRWWTPSCWASRGQQEAYLRKLYSKKYSSNGVVNPIVCTNDELPAVTKQTNTQTTTMVTKNLIDNSPWRPPIYELPNDNQHYLDAFLRTRSVENECPALSTPRASPTEKCVEFLTRNEARSRKCIADVVQRDKEEVVGSCGDTDLDEMLSNADECTE